MTEKTKLFGTDARHMTFKRDLDKLLKKHIGRLSAEHLLAISAQVTGMIIALQNQNTMTPESAMIIVSENIKIGNDGMVKNVMHTKGSA